MGTLNGTIPEQLERLYRTYNRREFATPDPVEFLYRYEDPADREIVGLIASSLAYGRVRQIKDSVAKILAKMGKTPSRFVRDSSPGLMNRTFSQFRHRFTTGEEMVGMLLGVHGILYRYGSLNTLFACFFNESGGMIMPALCRFAEEVNAGYDGRRNSLLPSPARGSACKRLHLFLRWMVRRDGVDPGGWSDIPPSALVVPLDTHMHRVCMGLGLTKRRQADIKTALEITDAFRKMVPHDPVRYDFVLTRPGIWRNAGVAFPVDMPTLQHTQERMTNEA
ncbi:MAG: TIGR02757 family protein [Deltaproteobacteria bacterium]|nr:TIGR02757 family protein [Deltaproteobacteria bacterium]